MTTDAAHRFEPSDAVRAALRVAASVCGEEHAAGVSDALWQQALLGPAAEFLARPGKEFRGALVSSSWAIGAGDGAPDRTSDRPRDRAPDRAPDRPRDHEPMPADLPMVVELIHAGSLIVDDIQDGSDTRRGGPALHRVWGTPIALNTGNWLYFAAQELLGGFGLAPALELALRRRTTRAMLQCHHGQALDLGVRVPDITQGELPRVVGAVTALKTAALTELAAVLGAIAAGAHGQSSERPPDRVSERAPERRDADDAEPAGGASVVEALARFGRELGTALQMLDDLGAIASPERRVKGAEDLRHGRLTWPWRWAALQLAPARYADLVAQAREATAGAAPEPLASALAADIEPRGRAEIRTVLGRATRTLVRAVPPSYARAHLCREVRRLERSYG